MRSATEQAGKMPLEVADPISDHVWPHGAFPRRGGWCAVPTQISWVHYQKEEGKKGYRSLGAKIAPGTGILPDVSIWGISYDERRVCVCVSVCLGEQVQIWGDQELMQMCAVLSSVKVWILLLLDQLLLLLLFFFFFSFLFLIVTTATLTDV